MLSLVYIVILAVGTVVLGFISGYFLRKYIVEAKLVSAEEAAKNILSNAEKEAEAKKREMLLEAKEEVHQMRKEVEKENREQRSELQRLERRLVQKEETLDRKTENIERKEATLQHKVDETERLKKELTNIHKEQIEELERLSGLTSEEARELLLENIKKETKHECAVLVKELETRAREDANKKAREIITLAIQRCAADHVAESTVSVVDLPNDEMKGRIIGREGRNIRTLETLTGIDLIIDDTPEAVILSGFDPIRREIAHIALQKLISDGRIHPARIEEMVEKAQKEVEQAMREEGEKAIFETSLHGIHPELVKYLGRLKYRTSYGQNVLRHSIEVAHIAANMASELGADTIIAKRAGLLHDIGKAVDHEEEGPHVPLGVKLARKYHESPEIIHAIAAHHGDTDPETVEAVLVQAADAISAARPGARRETLEAYIKRLTKLEEIADSFDGVDKAYAIQAGREIRIMVKPDHVDDAGAVLLARDIVNKVEQELEYPGQIKVVLIRETRAVEYAK